MAQKKSYSRYFIILQEDETGYSLASDKLPSGYTKLETKNDKCKVSYYVQNLKKDKEPYYMVLICNKKLVRLGALNIDEYGRAEITYEFAADNIADSKMPVDLIGGSAIVRMDGSKVVSVLSGFTSTEAPKDWRSYSLYEEKQEILRSEAPKVEVKQVEVIDAEIVEEEVSKVEEPREAESSEELKEEKNIFDEYEQSIEEIKLSEKDRSENAEEKQEEQAEASREEVPVDTVEVIKEEEVINKAEDLLEPAEISLNETRHGDKEKCEKKDCKKCEHDKDHHKEHEDKDDDYPTGTVGEFFKLIAEDFEELKDISKEIKKCKWYKVPGKNLEGMWDVCNYNQYTVVYHPMIGYYPYIKKHGHYALGYKYDSKGKMKYLVYGVPGTKKKCDQPYGGKSGFVTWIPAIEGDEKEDSFGYWLMFYDFRTSTIVIPVK